MKKIISLCLFCFFAFLIFTPSIPAKNEAFAANSSYQSYQMNVLKEYGSSFKDRAPGSEGESQAALYIVSELEKIAAQNSNFKPVQSSSISEGIQEFVFNSILNGLNAKSQNIIYYYKSNVNTEKKVVIACNYDAVAFNSETFEPLFVESESINGSAGSVAALLTIAKMLPDLNLPYNVEIAFFGAGESNNAGSDFYVKGILPETKEDILCMINIDNIAVGENLYFYANEIETQFSSFVAQNLNDNKLKVSQVDTIHLGKIANDGGNKLGLDYSHIAMSSDNINFMKEGIISLNFFAGAYSEGIVYGRS